MNPEDHYRRLAANATDDPTGWFEELYVAATDGTAVVPWDRGGPSALLRSWVDQQDLDGTGKRAVVVGCGLGRDAEYIAGLGFSTVGFDVSETAIATARTRHPDTTVEYVIADLLSLPPEWHHGFDLVVECMNVQALPEPPRTQAITNIPPLVAPGGRLIVVAVASLHGKSADGPPWPLAREEIDGFATDDLTTVGVEAIADEKNPEVYRWRAEYLRR